MDIITCLNIPIGMSGCLESENCQLLFDQCLRYVRMMECYHSNWHASMFSKKYILAVPSLAVLKSAQAGLVSNDVHSKKVRNRGQFEGPNTEILILLFDQTNYPRNFCSLQSSHGFY